MTPLDEFRAIVAKSYPSLLGSLDASLASGGERAVELADHILGIYRQLTAGEIAPLAEAFALMVMSCNRLQMKYELTGAYPKQSYSEVRAKVYDDLPGMTSYMFGLVCSQFAWANHFALWCWFEDRFCKSGREVAKVLEVAPGHGLLGLTFCTHNPNARMIGLDISPASIGISKRIAGIFGRDDVDYRLGDAMDLADEYVSAFDAVICGELMEHIPEPDRLLRNLHAALKPGGYAYVTAAITAAAPDHVYEFLSPEAVLEMAGEAGFSVVEYLCEETRPITAKAKGAPRTLAMILSRTN